MTRTMVVAGGASGIGLATVKQAIRDDWRVIIVDRQDPLETVDARLIRCDLLDADASREALEGIVRDEKVVDALVITIGVAMGGPLGSRDVEDWVRGFSTDTLSALRPVRSLLPALQAAATAKDIADVVVVGSIASSIAFKDAVVYGAAAAARHALGEQLRMELRTERIRARTIAAGFTTTPLNAGREHEIPAVTEQILAAPLHPEDVAAVVHHGLNLSPEVTVHDGVMVPTCQGWA